MSQERGPGPSAIAAEVESLYAQHGTTVLALCRSLLRDRAEAEDAAQQTFLSAQRALANGSEPRDPAPWLATIARNECFARIRARAVRPVPTADESEDVSPDAHATAVRRAQVADLRDALAGLPAQQREAILLREVRGLSYDEVAASLAVTTSAVESLLFRARRRLQLSLREAAAAVAPEGLLTPLRELAARLAGSGVAIPGLAKVVAVGVGAVAVAGGADVTPQLLRHGRQSAPVPAASTAAAAPQHDAPAATGPSAVNAFVPPALFAPTAFHRRSPVSGEHESSTTEHGAATVEHESEQTQTPTEAQTSGGETSGGSHEQSSGSSGGSSGDGHEQSSSSEGGSSGDGGSGSSGTLVFTPVPPPVQTSATGSDSGQPDGSQQLQQQTPDGVESDSAGG